ncbi:MAG: DUF1549 domain-containing protein [Planctomycetes bacterium]|nr:DUF1549 domain-containing protein [Planctomycetota bacterium]
MGWNIARPICLAICAWVLPAALEAAPTITKVEVFPPELNLTTSRDRQSFVVVAERSDGVTLDVTSQAKAKLADGKIAKIEGSTVLPVADGSTKLEIEFNGHKVERAVSVKEAKTERPVSFTLDVMAVFTRAGCNTGSCHGAARGKDGFNMSLFGFDPAGDHYRITHELGFRRVNLALPAESMLLEKADGSVPHTGGKRFEKNSDYYATVLRWLEAGAPNDVGQVPKVVRVEIYPPSAVLEGTGAKQRFIARAVYTDGTDRDVTDLTVFSSNNETSAQMTPEGVVTAAARGEAFIMARFDTFSVGSQVLVLPKGLDYVAPKMQPVNYIDQLVNAKLEKLRILPSEQCDDATFLRRITIDLTGLLPSEQEFLEFTADKDPQKRAKLIDRLLERREFSELWAMKWAEILLVRSNNQIMQPKGIYLYSKWLTDQIHQNRPIDKIVHDLLASSGSSFATPATNFYLAQPDALKSAENVAQVFMGIRTQCAQCHNHPFDRWTMDDYYSFASFFTQVGRKQAEDPREYIIFNRGGGEVNHPVVKKAMPPKFLGGPTPAVAGKDRRQVVADWLASADNPLFPTSVANRIWEHFFGMGVVQPVDDIRVSNPPSNPELFNALGDQLVKYNYDMKQLVRDICNSQAYQRATQRNASNEDDEKNFAHGNIRRIKAECLLDCISQATEAPERFRGLAQGSHATEIPDGATSSYFLTTFGRSTRETVCAADAKTDPTLSQSLHLINGATVEGKIAAGGIITKMLQAKKAPAEIIDTMYIRCLTRRPTEEEKSRLLAMVGEKDQAQVLTDVFWALLNSREFLFNH